MKEITVKFVDFWPSLNHDDNVFTRALRAKYSVTVLSDGDKARPDLLFYSAFGIEHYAYGDCVKIYFTGENDVPDFNECDYAISFHHIDFSGRHLRYPLYMTYEIADALNPPQITDEQALNRGFCTLLMRNSKNCSPTRLQIIDAVNSYKPVTFGGPYRNNIGGPVAVDGKIDFIAKFKFNLALENSSVPGYITEKIVEPLAAPTVPVYWGAPDVGLDFNPAAYINVADYDGIDSFIADLKRIDADSSRYLSMLRAPRLNADAGLDFDERLSRFLCGIADSPAVRRVGYTFSGLIYKQNYIRKSALRSRRLVSLLGRIMGVK